MIKAQDVEPQSYVRPSEENETTLTQNKKFSLGFSMGAAIPLGDFKSTNIKGTVWDFNSPDSSNLRGYAVTGFHFDITLKYHLTDDFGIMLYYGGNSNSFNLTAFSSSMGLVGSNGTGGYYTAEYLIGPYVSLALSNKFSINFNGMIGLVTNTYPTLSVAINDTESVERTFSGGAGFGYNLGAGLSYNVSDNVTLTLNGNYMGSTITYSGWTETDYVSVPSLGIAGTATATHSNDVTMVTGILKIALGIEFKF